MEGNAYTHYLETEQKKKTPEKKAFAFSDLGYVLIVVLLLLVVVLYL